MTTVHLIDEQFAQFTATGLIVVDGEPGYTERKPWPEVGEFSCLVAPELWRKLADPCPLCDGTDKVRFPAGDEWPGREVVGGCPDCAGGRQVVTLTATRCPQSHPYGRRCPVCATYDVTLGRFTIRLLPIVGWEQWESEGTAEPCITLDINGDPWIWVDDELTLTALNPLPQPGQWAVQFEAVAVPA